jgi:CheY-like chemotaxis protein
MLLRMRAVEIVEDAGFTPLEAVNADDALSLLEARSDIELLFTDIQMPGTMNGLKLAHAVHERCPPSRLFWCPVRSRQKKRTGPQTAASLKSR